MLRWVGPSSLLTPPPYRPWLILPPLLGQLFGTPDLVRTPGDHPEPLLLAPYVSQMDMHTYAYPNEGRAAMPEYHDDSGINRGPSHPIGAAMTTIANAISKCAHESTRAECRRNHAADGSD
jgi:hypothetical protein